MTSPYQVTKDLERDLAAYTCAPYVVCVNSCTAALQLSVEWYLKTVVGPCISIPSKTYVSVPCAIINAGARVVLDPFYNGWKGAYQLEPSTIWDCARRFTSGMYVAGQFQCVSFSTSKILGNEQGGAVLHDSPEADIWFRKMRFDGRPEGLPITSENVDVIGHHFLMLPSTAAALILKLYHLPKHNQDLGFYDYPDLSEFEVFK